jgi:hypothetical protein
VVAALLALAAVGEEMYRWTDERGQVHYGDRPGRAQAQSIAAPRAPVPEPGQAERQARQQRLLEAFDEERRRNVEQSTQKARDEQVRVTRCALARDYLRGLESAGQIYRLAANGERVYLEDTDRARALAEARDDVDHWCG